MEENKKKLNVKRVILTVVALIIICLTIEFIWSKKTTSIASYENINNSITQKNGTQENTIQENALDSNQNNISNKENNQIEEKNNNETTNNKNIEFKENTAFIGDSRTQGFLMYTGLNKVIDYTSVGLAVDTAQTKKIVKTKNGENITILEDLKNKQIDNIYIMLGINELGWNYEQIFINEYSKLIDSIKEIKPKANIYIQSIIYVSKQKSEADKIYNNANINKYNNLIEKMAKEKNVNYLNINKTLTDKEGNLKEDATTDGVHLTKEYCEKWLNYIKQNYKQDKTKTDIIAENIKNKIKFEDKLENMDIAMILSKYGIEKAKIKSATSYLGSGATAEEILVLEVNDKKDISQIKEKIKSKIKEKETLYKDYLPKERYKLQNYNLQINDKYIILCVADNTEELKNIIKI